MHVPSESRYSIPRSGNSSVSTGGPHMSKKPDIELESDEENCMCMWVGPIEQVVGWSWWNICMCHLIPLSIKGKDPKNCGFHFSHPHSIILSLSWLERWFLLSVTNRSDHFEFTKDRWYPLNHKFSSFIRSELENLCKEERFPNHLSHFVSRGLISYVGTVAMANGVNEQVVSLPTARSTQKGIPQNSPI